jgi:quinolinate synthase
MTTHPGITDQDFSRSIEELRARLGSKLALFGHHYMSDAVISHVDVCGDSLELARRVPEQSAEDIVFCGVYFMAESAAILAGEHQRIHIPDVLASCVMSDMAPDVLVANVVETLAAQGRTVVPLTYVNSSAGVKAVCGRYGGTVCTSANAAKMLTWARERGDAVLFLPDQYLAFNTADIVGIPMDKRHVLDIRSGGGRVDAKAAANAELLVWPGMCVIHHRFKPEQIHAARATDPDALVVVHPECPPAVVAEADACGSTRRIIEFVDSAPDGAVIYVGTELNLVDRLAKQHAGNKLVKPLGKSCCSNMAKITEAKLAALLERIASGTAEPVRVDPQVAADAGLALTRMLEASA